MTRPLLQLESVTAGYGRSRVVHEVSLEVRPGEIYCLLGPNGAGKSTVLKAVAGVATVHEGRIVLDGSDVTRQPTHALLASGVAYVPQGRINFPGLTILENLRMGGFLQRDRRALDAMVEDVLARFPALRAKLAARAGSLSGGEGQMLAIARGLVLRPRLLLLDEPSLGLAPKTAAEIFDSLRSLVADGMTILIVEQNVHLALGFASRGALLAAGKLVFEGTASQLSEPGRMQSLYLGG